MPSHASGQRLAAWVTMAFLAGKTPSEMADASGRSVRTINMHIAAAGLRPVPLPVPDNLQELVRRAAATHGPNYGVNMLTGALRGLLPGWRFPRRRVTETLQRFFPLAFASRR